METVTALEFLKIMERAPKPGYGAEPPKAGSLNWTNPVVQDRGSTGSETPSAEMPTAPTHFTEFAQPNPQREASRHPLATDETAMSERVIAAPAAEDRGAITHGRPVAAGSSVGAPAKKAEQQTFGW